jgi:hypothetical protein
MANILLEQHCHNLRLRLSFGKVQCLLVNIRLGQNCRLGKRALANNGKKGKNALAYYRNGKKLCIAFCPG